MSILRVVTSPADVPFGGFTYKQQYCDLKRVEGAFAVDRDQSFALAHTPAGTVWYHWRMALSQTFTGYRPALATVTNAEGFKIARLYLNEKQLRLDAYTDGETYTSSGNFPVGLKTIYTCDMQVVNTGTDITVRFYLNNGLMAEIAAPRAGIADPSVITFGNVGGINEVFFSEALIADEDTRGMRIRSLRPVSFGTMQEWDGDSAALRDYDLATGISTDATNRRQSFGVSNLPHIRDGDIINRVVCQTYAQRGENAAPAFHHFFRFPDGTIVDGAEQTLGTLGEQFLEEFPVNPDTGVAWEPEDFKSIQTGVYIPPT